MQSRQRIGEEECQGLTPAVVVVDVVVSITITSNNKTSREENDNEDDPANRAAERDARKENSLGVFRFEVAEEAVYPAKTKAETNEKQHTGLITIAALVTSTSNLLVVADDDGGASSLLGSRPTRNSHHGLTGGALQLASRGSARRDPNHLFAAGAADLSTTSGLLGLGVDGLLHGSLTVVSRRSSFDTHS